ncbi:MULTISPECIES: LysM peptidoglycan-binding domain-containing protein [Cyanophyceae]|uniref:LysM peptidoglycan-binding domain-containing protein n=1 Tax=Leptolyngbya subtilissima DQ-A4 TaxID=2933933 RepID=A0ABV0JZJ9_9CYAN|nr:LysM peptidoglycan-binding domain-containing protein [Nodosilinea sp. FACHB-141]MBD2112579.1 LysM peptidoglycan-binding domain-containing protein [Nodosilinea sp. FACHB-141]
MALERLTIQVEESRNKFSKEIPVLYNPNKLTIVKSGWKASANGLVPKDDPASLTVELFFDTSAPDKDNTASSIFQKATDLLTTPSTQAIDVRIYTLPIYNLSFINARFNLGRPPLCRLVWGGKPNIRHFNGSVLFKGVLQQVIQTFTHFTAEGMPVRATLNCTFLEWEEPEQQQKKTNPVDDPIRIIKQGETLSSIAQEEYGDSSLWRIIANANRLNNPRTLEVGSFLTVPPLPSQGGR